jgi:hypothetical protein
MSTEKIFENLKKFWDDFEENHTSYGEKANKAAAQRARKSIGEIKKLATEYRKTSVQETKK